MTHQEQEKASEQRLYDQASRADALKRSQDALHYWLETHDLFWLKSFTTWNEVASNYSLLIAGNL